MLDLRTEHGDYDVLKLDTEGMEADALRGDIQYLRSRKPIIWAECNENTASLDLFSVMRQLGYEPLYIAFPVIRRANYNKCAERLFPFAYEAALLAAPAERLPAFTTAATEEECIVRRVVSAADMRRALWDTPRWALSEWAEMTQPELIARLGRLNRGEDFNFFLTQDSEQITSVTPSTSDEVVLQLALYWSLNNNNSHSGKYTEGCSAKITYPLNAEDNQLQLTFPASRSKE